jgi:hypothetical protein
MLIEVATQRPCAFHPFPCVCFFSAAFPVSLLFLLSIYFFPSPSSPNYLPISSSSLFSGFPVETLKFLVCPSCINYVPHLPRRFTVVA